MLPNLIMGVLALFSPTVVATNVVIAPEPKQHISLTNIVYAEVVPEKPDFSSTTTIKAYVMEQAKLKGVDKETAVRIANCEGGLRQFNSDGSVLKGFVNPKDIGIFQINEMYHLKNAISLGFDIYTPQGNVDYAIDLMSKEGFTPWKWSETCWKYTDFSS